MEELCNVPDLLEGSNLKRFAKKLRSFILKSQRYRGKNNLVKSVSKDKCNSENRVKHVVKLINKRHPLSCLTDVYLDFNRLLKKDAVELMNR